MAASDSTKNLGSASWIGADEYGSDGEFHERATSFLATVKWDVLASISSRLRDGVLCKFSETYSIGHFNMVRHIQFADGVSWVARVKLPELFGDRDALDVASTLKVEVSSMKFLKAKTSIPVPEVHSYSLDVTNDVGAPYILMDYIHGTVAAELRRAKDCDIGLFGTPAQDQKFRQQMADIQVKLSSFTFNQIGSLYQDESGFFIGPDIETGKGPWVTSMDYYTDLANHVLQDCVRNAEPEVHTTVSFALPSVFQHLILLYSQSQSRSMGGPFRLMNRDFGAHNLLVNDDFEIIGLIDLDGVMAAPMEAVAQYPTLTGLDREPPGHIETKPAAKERIMRTEPRLMEYKELIGTAETEMKVGSDWGKKPIASLMLSDAASILQGLLKYRGHQKWVNDKWMEAYVKLLHSHCMRDMGETSIRTAIQDTNG